MCAGASHLHVSQTLTFAYSACDSFEYPDRMTLENLLSQVGLGTKQLTDRYSEYGAPMPEQHVYYGYEPSPPPQTVAAPAAASSKYHHSSGGGLKTNASMSALTLLAFLFFLHILQQCIKEHMTEMSSTPVVVMTAGREGEVDLSKSDKIDKTGISQIDSGKQVKSDVPEVKVNPFRKDIETDDTMMRINAAEHKPRNDYEYVYRNTEQSSLPGFVSAMDEE